LYPNPATLFVICTCIGMTAPDILKDLKARKFKPVYLLHGDEPYFIDVVSNYIEHQVLPDAEKGV
jgi:DNA polymerase-3 subunit delta